MQALLTPRRYLLTIGCCLLVTLAVLMTAPLIGAEKIDIWKAWRAWLAGSCSPQIDILLRLRLPRILLGFLTGAALALTGAAFQGLLHNPLATPYTLGIASGGSLGAVVAIYSGLAFSWGPFHGVQLLALVGAWLTLAMVYMLARQGNVLAPVNLLLGGVTLSMIAASLILLVRYLARPEILVVMDHWLMGGLDVTGYGALHSTLPFALTGMLVLLSQGWRLEQLMLGEEMAAARGVPVTQLQRNVLIGGALATAGVVAVTGPIGFVGLIVPHTLKRLIGSEYRLLLPCAALLGGAFLVTCDTLARTLMAPTELPVGVITSLCGGPFFLLLLVRGSYHQ